MGGMKRWLAGLFCTMAALSHAAAQEAVLTSVSPVPEDAAAALPFVPVRAQSNLPESIVVTGEGPSHVQGIALDAEAECLYLSFTTQFVKADLQGHVLASLDGIQGHLGAICFDPSRRLVFASLEYKDDQIGRGIAVELGVAPVRVSSFYIAVIDVDKLSSPDEAMRLFRVRDAVKDYADTVALDARTHPHRYGCSGIDGIAIGPEPGSIGGERFLYVAYGIYGDVTRSDNDYQVLLQFDIDKVLRRAAPVTPGQMPSKGAAARRRFFVRTGNTCWGVQNMAFDPLRGEMLLCVYPGLKPAFPNHRLYSVNWSRAPFKAHLEGVPYQSGKVWQLSLTGSPGKYHGWDFPYGSTGICWTEGSEWMVSVPSKSPDGHPVCTVRKYLRERDAEDIFMPTIN